MKLSKSPAGRILIVLYYVVLLGADVFLMIFVILKTGSLLAGLGVCLALSVGIGILGGELEFQEDRKVRHKKYFTRQKANEPKKVIDFPVKSSDAEQ